MSWDQRAALDRTPPSIDEWIELWRPKAYPDLELLAASFRTHRYAPHRHDTYVIGVNLSGVEVFDARGGRRAAGPGEVVLLNPDELHDGGARDELYAYRAFYPSIPFLTELAADVRGDPAGAAEPPSFDDLVLRDPRLARGLHRLHRALEGSEDPLFVEEGLTSVLGSTLTRYGRMRGAARAGREPERVARAIERLDAEPEAPVTLDELAGLAGLSRWHFLRVFRRATGQTPHAYLVGRRVNRARVLLAAGARPAEAAAAAGFADQSHLNRMFKRMIGITPGRYAAATR